MTADRIPEAWRSFLGERLDQNQLDRILEQLEEERRSCEVFPPPGKVFHALALTPPDTVRVVLIGQDPYHEEGQAEGLAFSVPEGVKFPPSLRNIFKEFAADLGSTVPNSGSLHAWAEAGVLLLNSVLTVRAHAAGSHRKLHWEKFTDSIIAALSEKRSGLVFILWGNYAIGKRPLIDETKHHVIAGVHPSPLSAHRGFFGSRPFSETEQFLPGWRWPRL